MKLSPRVIGQNLFGGLVLRYPCGHVVGQQSRRDEVQDYCPKCGLGEDPPKPNLRTRSRHRVNLVPVVQDEILYRHAITGADIFQGYIAGTPRDFFRPWLVRFPDGLLARKNVRKFASRQAAHKAACEDHLLRSMGL